MNYIVMDLEWNQSNTGLEEEVKSLPFEIIEIGAICLDDNFRMAKEFNKLIKPTVYHEMHQITSKLIHMQMKELERGEPFIKVAKDFINWCGEEKIFCTWGTLDLTELQRNMKFFDMTPLSDRPLAYLDVQKLFSIAYEDRKVRRSLEYAVDFLGIEKDIPFHRAFSDAYYTAKVFCAIADKDVEILNNASYDTFIPPKNRESEIRVQFDSYNKYISRVFKDKAAAFADREVVSSKCYLCHRNLRKKIRWFTPNGKHYYCVAYCDKHGYLKGKIRIHRLENDEIFIVKTTKLIDDAEAEKISDRREHAKEMKKKNKRRNPD